MPNNKLHDTRVIYFTDKLRSQITRIPEYPCTLIEAPMGYGKTTAVREYLKGTDAQVLWQRVYDDSVSGFWITFSRLFRELDPDRSEKLEQLGFPNDSVSMQEALKLLQEVAFPEVTVLVIDDYHLLGATDMSSFIWFLVVNEIDHLHIVLPTRFIERLNTEELSLKGFLYYIGKEVFELTPDEIMEYYRLCGISLRAPEAERLFSFTEGWISALYLIMLNYSSKGNTLPPDDIYALIDKVIYAPLSKESKHFLLYMSIFESYTLEQAEFIWDEDNSQAHINALVSRNAFITYDSGKKTYHMHSILTKFLRDKFDALSCEQKNRLYRNAACWFLKIGEFITSMHFAYLAADFETLFRVIEQDKCLSIGAEHKELLIKYVTECPLEIKRNHPMVILYFARKMFLLNEAQLLKIAFMETMNYIHNADIQDMALKNQLMGEYELLFSITAYNDIRKMSEHHRRAAELLKTPSVIFDGKNTWTMGSPSILYSYYRSTGELEQEVTSLKESIPFFYRAANNLGYGADLVMEAERYYYIGELKDAEITAHKAYLETQDDWYSGISLSAVFLKARIAMQKGDFKSVLSFFKVMRDKVAEKEVCIFHLHTLDICEAFIYSCLNDCEHIAPWLLNGNFNEIKFAPSMGFVSIVFGRIMLIKKQYLEVLGSADRFFGIASTFHNLLVEIHTYIYLAAANEKIFRRKNALDTLQKALEISMPDKLYMPFVENGDYIKPLLEELSRQGCFCEDIAKILELYIPYQEATGKITEEYFNIVKPALTEREEEIAKLAAEGFSNKQIGKTLFISENTVKTQLKSVFEKLGVNSRTLIKQNIDR